MQIFFYWSKRIWCHGRVDVWSGRSDYTECQISWSGAVIITEIIFSLVREDSTDGKDSAAPAGRGFKGILKQFRHWQPSEQLYSLFLQPHLKVWHPNLHLKPYVKRETLLWIKLMFVSLSQSMHLLSRSICTMQDLLDGLCWGLLDSTCPQFSITISSGGGEHPCFVLIRDTKESIHVSFSFVTRTQVIKLSYTTGKRSAPPCSNSSHSKILSKAKSFRLWVCMWYWFSLQLSVGVILDHYPSWFHSLVVKLLNGIYNKKSRTSDMVPSNPAVLLRCARIRVGFGKDLAFTLLRNVSQVRHILCGGCTNLYAPW